MNLPNELLYSKEHEWVRKEGSDVRIGITDFAQSELGDIVFVELPEVGDTIEVDEPFGSVESVKTVSERSEEHTSELQSRGHLVCRLLLEKTNSTAKINT